MRSVYRFLSVLGDAKALRRSPSAYARRKVRSRADREFAKAMRRLLKP